MHCAAPFVYAAMKWISGWKLAFYRAEIGEGGGKCWWRPFDQSEEIILPETIYGRWERDYRQKVFRIALDLCSLYKRLERAIGNGTIETVYACDF